jgi:hypothetical protein
MKFNRLTVMSEGERNRRGRPTWICLCECGNETVVETPHFQKTVSCGCYLREVRSKRSASVIRRKSIPLYATWKNIRQRCTNPARPDFKHYGGRGIAFHAGWDDFLVFERYVADELGEKPSRRHSIDRIETNKGYEPGNIRWATQQEQCNNKRTNRKITCDGVTLGISQWARRTGLSISAIHARISRGWDECRAVSSSRHNHPTHQ